MSTNTEIIRALYAAFARSDIDAAMKLFSPAIEWTKSHGTNDYKLDGTMKGLEQFRDSMTQVDRVFSGLRPTPREFVESGDRVMVIGAYYMPVAHSEQTRQVPFVHSWRLAGGKATHFEDYHDTASVRTLLGTNEVEMTSREQVLRLGLGFWSAKTLLVAVELGVFTELAAQPLDAETLRVKLGLHDRSARDFFDALVALKLLDREDGFYRNTPTSAEVLDESNPEQYFGGFLKFMNNHSYSLWGNLKFTLQTGLSQNHTEDGKSELFDVLYAQPEPLRTFLRGMTSAAMGAILALVERFPWKDYKVVADVGCAEGALLSRVLRRHPHLSGIGLDLPPVGPIFAETAEQFSLVDRMTFVAGDFFTDPLPSADVIVLGHVLHDWDLETRRMLLEKAYKALPDGGSVIVYELLIDDDRRHNTLGLLTSLHMRLVSSGGSNYTGADCIGWLSDAGFRNCYVEHLWGPDSMVVGTK